MPFKLGVMKIKLLIIALINLPLSSSPSPAEKNPQLQKLLGLGFLLISGKMSKDGCCSAAARKDSINGFLDA